jgi:hypothetical protein
VGFFCGGFSQTLDFELLDPKLWIRTCVGSEAVKSVSGRARERKLRGSNYRVALSVGDRG